MTEIYVCEAFQIIASSLSIYDSSTFLGLKVTSVAVSWIIFLIFLDKIGKIVTCVLLSNLILSGVLIIIFFFQLSFVRINKSNSNPIFSCNAEITSTFYCVVMFFHYHCWTFVLFDSDRIRGN